MNKTVLLVLLGLQVLLLVSAFPSKDAGLMGTDDQQLRVFRAPTKPERERRPTWFPCFLKPGGCSSLRPDPKSTGEPPQES